MLNTDASFPVSRNFVMSRVSETRLSARPSSPPARPPLLLSSLAILLLFPPTTSSIKSLVKTCEHEGVSGYIHCLHFRTFVILLPVYFFYYSCSSDVTYVDTFDTFDVLSFCFSL